MAQPKVSVVIPTHNESDVIVRNLQALKNQDYINLEVIVVDDGSVDRTVEISKKYTSKVFKRSHSERSIQRNFGAKKSNGVYLLFLDADMELTSNVISECVMVAQSNPQFGAIAIPETPVATNFLEQVKAFERGFYSLQGDPDTDAARFFTRSAFLTAGGYDESLTGPEDWDLPDRIVKLGYQRGRITARIIHYERVKSLFKLMQKKYYYALSAHKYFSKHQLSVVGAKSIYFLRPVFYKHWRKLISHPLLTLGMILVLTAEQFAGAIGYLVGRYKS